MRPWQTARFRPLWWLKIGFPVCCGMWVLVLSSGCARSQSAAQPPATLVVPEGTYEAFFDEVIEVSRASGMPAVLRDRSGGLIETAPRISGSIFEPWRQDNASLAEGLENTFAFQRRRARFEFVPASFVPPPLLDPSDLTGAPLPGAKDDDVLDMRTYEGPIEVRIWVYVERAFTPGVRTGTWTRSQTTYSSDRLNPVQDDSDGAPTVDRSKWTPVRRDVPYEHRLLHALDQAVTKNKPEAS